MQSAEVIRQLEAFFDPETLDLQIRYLRAISEVYPKRTQERRELELLTEARRLMGLLIKQCANKQLGTESQYFNDPELYGRDYWQDYESFQQYRVMTAPRQPRKQEPEAPARASVQQRTAARPATQYRNDLTRRSEGCEAREERKQSMRAHWRNAERMQELVHRVNEAYAELMRQARVLKAAASHAIAPRPGPVDWSAMGPQQIQPSNPDQSAETTVPVAPLNEQSGLDESHDQVPVAGPSMNSGQAAMGADPARQLTPLQQATLTAIGNWLLVIGHCGSTKLTTGRSTKLTTDDIKSMAQARRPRPVQAVPRDAVRREVRRYSTLRSVAGPGGACFRIAA